MTMDITVKRHVQKPGERFDDESVMTFCATTDYQYRDQLDFIISGKNREGTFEWFTMQLTSGETLGIAVVQRHEDVIILQHMVVGTHFRNQGFGTKMLDTLLSEKKTIILSTSGKLSIDFYRARGFHIALNRTQMMQEAYSMFERMFGECSMPLDVAMAEEPEYEFMASSPIDSSKFSILVSMYGL